MNILRGLAVLACALGLVTGCSDGTGPSQGPSLTCVSTGVQNLAVGQCAIINTLTNGNNVRVPAAGAGGAEYLYVALSAASTQTEAEYGITGGASVSARVAALPDARLSPFRTRGPAPAATFHDRLRLREQALARSPAGMAFSVGPQHAVSAASSAPPALGSQDTFSVCADFNCDDFVQTTATVKHVGRRVVIYIDDGAPTEAEGGYSQADIEHVGELFDNSLYPIDTLAFGRESDIDGNGVVIVLLTQHVNDLSMDCSQSVILGYFFGLDLHPALQGSNGGEIFYGIVPTPNRPTCALDKEYATTNLPPVFIHEFQHMISYNQHVLVRHSTAEELWLNEGLSHFAEELGGHKVPNAECFDYPDTVNDCLTQFAVSNFDNAYRYLTDPESQYLVASDGGGSLEERGAGWLFVRWLADQFGTDAYGTNVTRQLDRTNRNGVANVEAVTGEPFAILAPQWQMANYLDNLPDFTAAAQDARLQYSSWDLRAVFSSFHQGNPSRFPAAYPLEPDQVTTAPYEHAGVLRAGSGRHLLIVQPPSGGAVEIQLTGLDGTSPLPTSIVPRIALIRVR